MPTQSTEVERLIANELQGDVDANVLKAENMKRFGEMSTVEQREILSRTARIRLFPKGRGKRNVPMKHQVEMDLVTYWKSGKRELSLRCASARPTPSMVNTDPQPRKRARGERAGRLKGELQMNDSAHRWTWERALRERSAAEGMKPTEQHVALMLATYADPAGAGSIRAL